MIFAVEQKGEMMDDRLISLNAAIAVADYTDYTGLAVEDVKKVTDEVVKGLKQLPSAQPDNRVAKIADLVERSIGYFDLDDAMDLLYQIKEVLQHG